MRPAGKPGGKFAYVPLFEGFEGLSRVARAVWFGLCSFAKWEGGTGSCYPSQAQLGRRIGFAEKAVKRGLDELAGLGVLRCERRRAGFSLTYVVMPWGSGLGAEGGPSPRRTNNTNITKTTPIPEDGLTPEQGERLFEALWGQYRRYNGAGRAEARRAFEGMFPAGLALPEAKTREEALINLLNEQAAVWEELLELGERRYIPRMANWLRREFGGLGEAAA